MCLCWTIVMLGISCGFRCKSEKLPEIIAFPTFLDFKNVFCLDLVILGSISTSSSNSNNDDHLFTFFFLRTPIHTLRKPLPCVLPSCMTSNPIWFKIRYHVEFFFVNNENICSFCPHSLLAFFFVRTSLRSFEFTCTNPFMCLSHYLRIKCAELT